jgi:hypothetical protein
MRASGPSDVFEDSIEKILHLEGSKVAADEREVDPRTRPEQQLADVVSVAIEARRIVGDRLDLEADDPGRVDHADGDPRVAEHSLDGSVEHREGRCTTREEEVDGRQGVGGGVVVGEVVGSLEAPPAGPEESVVDLLRGALFDQEIDRRMPWNGSAKPPISAARAFRRPAALETRRIVSAKRFLIRRILYRRSPRAARKSSIAAARASGWSSGT